MYQIIFSKKALKSLQKIPTHYQILIKKRLEKLSLDPFKLDIRKLSAAYKLPRTESPRFSSKSLQEQQKTLP